MSSSETSSAPKEKQPTTILCIGMAGSGKTTFMQVYIENFTSIQANFWFVKKVSLCWISPTFHFTTASECWSTCEENTPVYTQPWPCCQLVAFHRKHWYQRYRQLQRSDETVRTTSLSILAGLFRANHGQHVHCRYNLGPNGGILTSLNLFTTKFDQVLKFVDKRAASVE